MIITKEPGYHINIAWTTNMINHKKSGSVFEVIETREKGRFNGSREVCLETNMWIPEEFVETIYQI